MNISFKDTDINLTEELIVSLLCIYEDQLWNRWLSSFIINDFVRILNKYKIKKVPNVFNCDLYQLMMRMCYKQLITRNELRQRTEQILIELIARHMI